MKKSKKISVLISLVLILLLAIGAASAADDAIMTDDSDLASVDEVQTVDNTQTTDEIYTEPTDIVVTDTGDSGDLDDADSDVISDTGLKGDSDDGEEAVVSDASSPKNALKAETNPDEPLRAPDGSFRDLNTLISNAQSGSTITLDRNYVYNPSTDNNYRNGILVNKTITINGNGFTIDGQGAARGLILGGYTTRSGLINTNYHGYTYVFNNINFVNLVTTADAGAAIASHVYPNTVTISNCNFTNNRGNRGAISVSVQDPSDWFTNVDTGSVTITGSIFKDNYASDRGGAIYSGISYDRTSITANNNVFINNTAAGYGQAIFYSNANYINVNYNWWGQNAWNNNFVAQSNNNRITPTYRYLADFTQTSGKTLELTLALNGGTAPSGSTLPARNASFSIDSGIVDPESEMFQGSIEVTYASLEDTTITANVDNQQFTLEVSKTPRENINELTITVADVVLPNQAQVIVNTDVRGTFNVTIGDTVKEVNITNGQATIAWDSLPAGQYFAVVSCVGDIRYNDKFAYTSFKVEKQNVTITVTATPDTIVYGDGETVTLSSTLNDTAATEGTVTYYVDGTESGTTLNDLTIGTYEVIAKYTGDPNYNDAESVPITVTVAKPTPTISVTANPILYGQDATITIGLHGLNDESITGLVKVTINGKIYDVAVSNGVGTLTVSGLAAREDGYPISVEFAGNENYHSANNYSTKQVVHKAQPVIGVTPVEISYGEVAVVNISLELPNGEKLDDVVVIATVDGEDYPVTINDGVGTLTVRNLIVDNYDVILDFPGNDNYESVETTRYGIIVVKKAVVNVSVGNVVVTRPNTGTIVFSASAPGEYIVKVGDVEYQANVDFADVPVEIPVISMLAGSYDVTVTADEAQNYEAVDVTFEDAYIVIKCNVTVEATPNATEIGYGEQIKLNHSISAPEGAVLTGDVTYYIDGEKAESIFTGSKVGTYTFTVSYTGDPDFNDAVSAPVTITVNKFVPIFMVIANNRTYGDHPHISLFTLRDKTIYGGISGITVLVTINNMTYAVETTDFMGGTVLELNDLDANEEGYSISAVTLETDEYASVSNNTEVLKIYKVDTRLTIDSDRVSLDYGETSTLSHWITEGATGAVTYYLNGTAISGNVLSNLMPGNYTVTAKYEGDKNYKPADSENTLDITVKKINPRLSVSANNTVIKYLDSIKLLRVFDTPASGEVVWYVNGTAQMSNIIENLKPGTYTVTAKYIEDEIYYDADSLNSLTITILKDDVDITVRSDKYRIPYGDSINLHSLIEPLEAQPWENEVIYIVDGRETSNPAVSGLGVGTHTIIAKYVENDYFNEAYSEAITVNVDKATPSIEVESDPVTYPNDAVVNFIVKGNNNVALPGVGLRVTINGIGYYVETGSDGKAVLTVKGLNVGEYTIGTVTVANDNYGVATNNTEKIVVNKGDLTITAGTSASSVAYGDEISFTNTITTPEGAVAAGTVKYFVDGNEIDGDSISTLAIGDHTVVAEYSGDTNFNAVNSTAVSFTVTKADPTLTISANATEIQYLDDIKLSYTLTPDGATGSVVYYLDDEPVDGDVLRMLGPGNYTVTAKYEGNDYYNEADSSNSLKITVGKCDVSIEVNSNYYTIEYGDAILLSAAVDPFRATGHITYIVDGLEGDEVYFTDLSVGTHYIAARFNENVYYNGALSEAKTVTVTKATPVITVTANPIAYGQDATITIGLDGVNDEKITGVVKVTIGGKDYDIAVINGAGTLTVSGLAANAEGHAITAAFAGNDNYDAITSTDAKQVVNKAQSSIDLEDVIVTYGEDAVVEFTVNGVNGEKLGDFAYLSFNYGPAYIIDLHDGVGRIRFSGLDARTYNVQVSYEDNDNYDRVVKEANVIVKKATADVNVTSTTVVYPNTGSINLTASVPGQYVVKVGGVNTYTVTVETAGTPVEVEVTDVLGVYGYDVSVTADLGSNYELVDTGKIGTYNVVAGEASLEITVADFTYGETASATITLKTGNIPIDSKDIVVNVGGIRQTVTTNASGEATVDLSSLNAGDYRIVAMFAGDNNYPAASDEKGFRVNKALANVTATVNNITYGEDAEVKITVTGAKGENLNGVALVTFYTGELYNVAIKNGMGSVNVSGLPANELGRLYAVQFEETENHNATAVAGGLIVHKANVTVSCDNVVVYYPAGGVITITASVPGQYKVKVGDKEYTANIATAGGSAEVSVDTKLAVGKYDVTITGEESENYTATERTFTEFYTVLPGTVGVSIAVSDVTYPNEGTITVTASVPGVYTVKVGDNEYTANIATAGGSAEVTVDTLDAGKYDLTVNRSNIENYDDVLVFFDGGYSVNPATVVVTVTSTTVVYPNKGSINLTASVRGYYNVSIGNMKTYEIYVPEAGVPVEVVVDELLSVYTYDVSVKADLGKNYKPVDTGAIGTYNVIGVSPSLEITVGDFTYGDAASATITLKQGNIPIDSKDIVVTVGGIKKTVTTNESGEATVDLSSLNAGDYHIVAIFAGDYNYPAASDEKGFRVNKAVPTVTATANDITYGEDAEVNITVTGVKGENLNGVALVTFYDGEFHKVAIKDGMGSVNVSGLNANEGGIAYTVEFEEIENYKDGRFLGGLRVHKANVTVSCDNVVVYYPAAGVITVTASVPGEYKVVVGDKEYTANIETAGGSAEVSVATLDEGLYNVTISGEASANYKAVERNFTNFYIVYPGSIEVGYAVSDVTYPDKGTITIAASVAGVYTVEVGGKQYTANIETAGGSANVIVDTLNVGKYDILITRTNIDNYDDLSKVIYDGYVVNPATAVVSCMNVTHIYPDYSYVVISSNVPGWYYVKVGEEIYEVRVAEDGYGLTAPLPWGPGVYDVSVTADLGPNYNPVDTGKIGTYTIVADNITITGEDSSVAYPGKTTIKINTNVAGTYTIKVGDKTYENVELVAGENTFEVRDVLPLGAHAVKVSANIEGYEPIVDKEIANYTVVNGDITVTGQDGTATYPGKGTIVITTDVAGNYTIIVGDKTYENVELVAGENTFEVPDVLPVGDYPVKVSANIANYNPLVDKEIATYTVNAGTITVTGKDVTVAYPGKGNITITTNVAGAYTIKVGDKTYENVELVAGENTFEVPDVLAIGNYPVNVYANIENYYVFDDIISSYIVNAGTITVTGQDGSATYPNKGTIVITTDVAGNYTIKVGDKTYENIELAVGENTFEVPDVLAVGNYPVKVSADIEGYDPLVDKEIANYTVVKANLTIEVDSNATEIFYGDEIEFYCYFNVSDYLLDDDAVVTYYVDGKPIKGDSTSIFSAGRHVVVARYTGDANFNDAESAPETFYVYKITPIIEVLPIESTYPNGQIKIVVTDDEGDEIEDITVIVSVGGVNYAVETDYSGIATLNIEGLDAGTYDITAVTVEDDAYRSASNDTEQLVVKKVTATVSIEDSVVVTYPETGSIQIKASVPGTYTVKVGNEEIPVVITEADKYVSVPVKLLDADVYDVSVTADLGKNYESVSTGTLATYTVNNGTIVVSAPNTVVAYPGKGDLYITTNAEGEYTIKVGDKTYTTTLFAGENRIYVEDEFALGTYDVVVSAAIPNYNVVENQKIATYTVEQAEVTVYCDNVTVYYPNYMIVTIFASVDGEYTITIANEEHAPVTVSNGKGYLYPHTWIPVGVHDVIANADLGENYKPVINQKIGAYTVLKADLEITVVPNATSILYGDEISLDYRADMSIDENHLTYIVDGQDIEGNLVSGLSVGTHTVAVKYTGDSGIEDIVSTPVSITVAKAVPEIEVRSIDTTYPNPAIVEVTVKNDAGAPLAGVTVRVSVNGVDYAVVTDSTGQAILTINGLNAGEYPIAAVSVANDNYEDGTYSGDAKVVVKKAVAAVSVNDVTVTYPDTGVLYLNASVAGNYTVIVGNNNEYNVTVSSPGALTAVDVGLLDVAAYNVRVTADLGDNYEPIDNLKVATYTVKEGTILVSAQDVAVTYPEKGTIRFNTNAPGTYIIRIGDEEYTREFVAGDNELEIPETFDAGAYDVVVGAVIPNYDALDYTKVATYTVEKANISVYCTNVTVTYPGVSDITVYSNVDGSYRLYIVYGTIIDGEIVDGQGQFTPNTSLAAGTYDVYAVFMGDDVNYNKFEGKIGTYTVEKLPVEITVVPNATTIAVGEDISLGYEISPEDADQLHSAEYISYIVDGVAVDSNVVSGLSLGEHTVAVKYSGDPNMTDAESAKVTITVSKVTPTIDVVGARGLWSGDAAPVTVNVMYGDVPVDGTVIITVNGEDYVGTLNNGQAKFTIYDLPANLYYIAAEYLGNDKYNPVEYTGDAYIDFNIYDVYLDISITNGTYGDELTVTVENVTDSHGDYVDGVVTGQIRDAEGNIVGNVAVLIENGRGVRTIAAPCAGTLTAALQFIDDYYDYASEVKNVTFTVAKAQSDIAVSYYEGLFTITLDGVNGEKLNESIIIEIDGSPQEALSAVTKNGVYSFMDSTIAPGSHTIVVGFAGNKNYLADYDDIGFNVPKVPSIVKVTGATVDYGEPATVKVEVTDDWGRYVTGTVIVVASWDVDGETQVIELEFDGTGEATFVLAGVAPGTVDLNATFLGNDKYASSYNDTEKIIIKDSTDLSLEVTANEVTVGEDTILTVTAKDGTGAGIDLDQVNVSIDGGEPKLYSVGEDGTINLGALEPGEHTIVVSVDDELYGHVEGSTEAKVNKLTANVNVVPGNGTVNITAKDNKTGEPISGTATIVIDGGEPKEVTIGEDGTIEYDIDAAPGPHTVEVTFNKEGYEPASQTVVVTVPKAETTLTIAGEGTPTYGDDVTVKATITEGAKGTITYYVDGSSVGTELAIGQDFVISGLSAGEHTITAKYAGNENYTAAESNILKVNIEKADLEITIVSAQTYYPNTGTVEVSANNDGEYTINVNGKPYTVFIVNGKGSFEVTEVLPVAEYPITWDIEASENYTGNAGSAIYKVLNTEPDFSISGSSEIDYGKTNAIVPTINADATGTITYSINGEEVDTLDVKENFVTDVLDAGHYTVTATYSGDVNYGSKTATFEFDVLPIDVVVSVASDEVYYPNLGSVNLTASAPGTYTVLVGNKSYEVVVTEANVPVTVEVTDLFEVGKYEINVTAPASTNYNAVDTGAIGTYVVSKAKSIIKVEYDSATGMATVTLEGAEDHVPLSESISFELDGTSISGVETTDGVYVSDDLALAPGKHSIFVVFVGNDNYLGSYDQIAFEVDKFATAEVTVSAEPIKEGEDAIINIAVKDGDKGLTGVVTVTLDGTDYAVDVTDGAGSLTVKNLVATTSPVTTYDITAKFNGNDEYAEATGTGTIDVTDYNDVLIVISGGQDSAVATLVDTDGNNITGKVNVTVDGEGPEEYDVVDGKVIIPIDEKGDHEITVDYPGDETHPSASETDTVYVGKTLIATTLTLTVSDITYTEDEEAVVVLSAEDGSRLTGTVTLTIGDKVQEVTITDGVGVTTVSGLSAGKKTAIAEFAESGKYAYAIATAPFEVRQMNTRIVARNMTTTAINVTEDGRIGQYFVWTLVDEKGRPLAGKAMSIGFNANVYNRTTDANGQARLQINLQNSGTYTFAISFLGDDNYNGSFEVVKITVNKQKATLTASGATYKASAKTKTLSATYKTKAGKPIVGKTIKFTVNGKTYSAKTDSKGVAKVNVSLTKAGSYTVEVKAPATNTYAETIKKVTLKLT